MALKSYERFLDFTSMGAVGTKKIRDYLESQGHKIIGLDRSSQSNKIWATKIKQLRAPDLLCLKCGQRIESRAKSRLQITMSDTPLDHLLTHTARPPQDLTLPPCSLGIYRKRARRPRQRQKE